MCKGWVQLNKRLFRKFMARSSTPSSVVYPGVAHLMLYIIILQLVNIGRCGMVGGMLHSQDTTQ